MNTASGSGIIIPGNRLENAQLLNMTKEEHLKKKEAIDKYIYPKAPCGKPWSGTLPKIFIHANRWNKELYFKIR